MKILAKSYSGIGLSKTKRALSMRLISASLVVLLLVVLVAPIAVQAADVTISTNFVDVHQTMAGFGGTQYASADSTGDDLTSSQRSQVVDKLYSQVHLNLGYNRFGGVESTPSNADNPIPGAANDNNDAFNINWSGFNNLRVDLWKTYMYDNAPVGGAREDEYPSIMVCTRWFSPWLTTIRSSDYNLYLDEIAEQCLAKFTHWVDLYGFEPTYAQMFNEPTSGNGEMVGSSTQELVDIVKRVGARLRGAGYNTVKLVVVSEETLSRSIEVTTALLADATARQYIGAVGYHTYPYGSAYSNVAHILDQSGTGSPDSTSVSQRNQLRDLVAPYGIPLWMDEVSNPLAGYNNGYDSSRESFDVMRGRAIHIHDELLYADAAAFFGMNTLWTTTLSNGENGVDDPNSLTDNIVVVDEPDNYVYITPIGRAIGHYARWINPGAVRVGATSTNSMVQVTAFKDDTQDKAVWVLINNNATSKSVDVNLSGAAITGNLNGERSTSSAFWQALTAFAPNNSSSYSITLPAKSVTTVSGALSGGGGNQAPTVSITSPSNGASYTAPANITINASASDSDGTISKVEFYNGGTKLGEDTSSPYSYTWNNATGGSYSLTALAWDNLNATTQSTAINITVTGLIAEWKLDENTGTSASDNTGNGHTGTLTSGPAWTAGKVNSALNFDGSNDYVAVPDFVAPSNLTMEAWIYPGNPGAVEEMILQKNSSEYDFRILDNGQLAGIAGGTSLVDTSFNYYAANNINKWYHVVYTFDNASNTHKLYRNGVEVASGSNNANISDTANALWIGRNCQYNFGTFLGKIDEVRLYNGALSAADVLARYNATSGNQAPTVSITSPSNGASFTAPATVTINASASDSDGTISKVEFFQGATKLGEDSTSPYSYSWNNVSVGSYSLTAVAWDNLNAATTSSPAIGITVTSGNQAPTTSITSPSNGTTYVTPTNIIINADASDSDGTISKVEFFQGATKLGEDSTSPYSFTWSNVGAGSYSLTSKAWDDDNANTTSTAVNITVTAPIAEWKLDENTGTSASDNTGNGHTGTLTNGPAWTTGRVNSALNFDGSNDYVAVSDFAPPSNLTIEAWVYPGNNNATDSIILDKNNSEYDFRINENGNLTGVVGGTTLADSTFNFYDANNINKWYHVVYTFDNASNTHKLYRNGTEVSSGTNSANISDTSNALWIGRHSQFNFGTFLGKIDEVRLYNRALTATEVLARYNAVP